MILASLPALRLFWKRHIEPQVRRFSSYSSRIFGSKGSSSACKEDAAARQLTPLPHKSPARRPVLSVSDVEEVHESESDRRTQFSGSEKDRLAQGSSAGGHERIHPRPAD